MIALKNNRSMPSIQSQHTPPGAPAPLIDSCSLFSASPPPNPLRIVSFLVCRANLCNCVTTTIRVLWCEAFSWRDTWFFAFSSVQHDFLRVSGGFSFSPRCLKSFDRYIGWFWTIFYFRAFRPIWADLGFLGWISKLSILYWFIDILHQNYTFSGVQKQLGRFRSAWKARKPNSFKIGFDGC